MFSTSRLCFVMPDDDPSSVNHPRNRRITQAFPRVAAYGSAVLIVSGSIGQAIRDRSVGSALLMYIPLLPLGVAATVLDAAWKGRSLHRIRFGLTSIGLAAIVWSAQSMMGSGVLDQPGSRDRELSVLHWNVLWGGGLFRGPATWAAQCKTIVDMRPDVIVLSEAPPGDWLDRLVEGFGQGASYVGMHHDPRRPYWYRLAVCSRWPIRLEEQLALPGGVAMSVSGEVKGRRFRLLVVDGLSSPMRSRIPFLHAIAEECRKAVESGHPYSLVLGDFNTPSRSRGFDSLEALGYRLAGRSARGWRGTFPSWLPVYDIDHVWLGAGVSLGSCTFFNGPYSDHRGQIVRVYLPKEARP
jgi:endonuclease/exonuclease/phosphatase family metal-dependent hydrolase